MQKIIASLVEYVSETRSLDSQQTSTENTFYPAIKTLISAILKEQRLPFEVRVNTSQAKEKGYDNPDFVLGDGAFVGVFGEVKRTNVTLEDLALSTEQNDQIGRYLTQTGVALLSNVREFGLLACVANYERPKSGTVPPNKRALIRQIDLWSAVIGKGTHAKVDGAALVARFN